MASEITISASISYEDSKFSTNSLSVSDAVFSAATKLPAKFSQNIGTSEEAINLAGITAPAYAMFVNRDETNYVELKTGTGGTVFAKLRPDTNADGTGGLALLELGSGAQAPYAIANTAACDIDVFIISL